VTLYLDSIAQLKFKSIISSKNVLSHLLYLLPHSPMNAGSNCTSSSYENR